MLKNISNLGSVLKRNEQKSIKGGIHHEQEDDNCSNDMSDAERAHCCFVSPSNIYCLIG